LTLPIVLAFGGHALLPDLSNSLEQEMKAEALARALLLTMPTKAGMVLLHGNGPQVGMILLRIEATQDQIPPETLDVLVAETQGSIGYLLTRALRNAMTDQGEEVEVATVMTQVLVDQEDPGFDDPSKPVGPYYTKDKASQFQRAKGWQMVEVPGRGWRRAVPSPRPEEIVELHTIEDAVSHGHIVIAGGGGGIPVVRDAKGHLHGVEAVIDKDRTAALLAVSINAAMLVILTDVPHVAKGFKTPEEERIPRIDVAAAQSLLAAGEFSPGSMGPKVESAAYYAKALGRKALITDVDHLKEALSGIAGTWVVP
jgi:carbamate kinase